MATNNNGTENNSKGEGRSKAKGEALDLALSQIEKQFGRGAIMRLGEQHNLEIEAIPTGSLALDLALGIGGVPRGRITEIFGPESSGKSTLCQHIIAQAQAAGGMAAYIDVEHALEPTYASGIGVKVDDLLVSKILHAGAAILLVGPHQQITLLARPGVSPAIDVTLLAPTRRVRPYFIAKETADGFPKGVVLRLEDQSTHDSSGRRARQSGFIECLALLCASA